MVCSYLQQCQRWGVEEETFAVTDFSGAAGPAVAVPHPDRARPSHWLQFAGLGVALEKKSFASQLLEPSQSFSLFLSTPLRTWFPTPANPAGRCCLH